MEPELEKLRRFCMVIALVLITYVFAGVKVDVSKTITVLGLPLSLSRPELIPIALIIASVYNTLRFYYYGFLLRRSPAKKRRDLEVLGNHGVVDREFVREFREDLENSFPQFRGHRVTFRSEQDPISERILLRGLVVPRPVRISAWFHNLDYTAPILLNVFAWILTAWWLWHGMK
jgi:hypothetical protein